MLKFSRALMMGAFSGLVLVGATTAGQAQTASGFLTNLFGPDPDQPSINYSERAPLVVPKKHDLLVTPGDAASLEADPSWPNDPDVKKKKKLQEKMMSGGLLPTRQDKLSPDELRAVGNNPLVPDAAEERVPMNDKLSSKPLSPDVLRKQKMGSSQDEVPLVVGQDAPRRSLIDPPRGMRAPVATAPLDDSVELPSEAAAKAKKSWWDFSPAR